MALLLRCAMLAQSTLISYHTEAFVKTEVGCTVARKTGMNKMGGQENCQITPIGKLSNIHMVKLSNIHTVKLSTFVPINSNHHGHTVKLSN